VDGLKKEELALAKKKRGKALRFLDVLGHGHASKKGYIRERKWTKRLTRVPEMKRSE